jgi:methyltransferase OMS1, mitochondrial
MAAAVSRGRLVAGGVAVFGAGLAAALALAPAGRPAHKQESADGGAAPTTTSSTPTPSVATFDAIAPSYDARIDREEFWMGVPLLRRWLISKASGDVLEAAVGTGRNLRFYRSPPSVSSLVCADPSAAMLARAAGRAEDRGDGEGPPVAFVQARAEELVSDGGGKTENREVVGPASAAWPAPRRPPAAHGRVPPGAFDTVVDTFGLCSMQDPVAGLRELARALKPGGRVLLLEHGRSGRWAWLDARLDAGAAAHARAWGCAHNRDIPGIVRGAGLEIVSSSTWHFGTTHVIEARLPAGAGAEEAAGAGAGGR